jgi:mannose-1-phosphate guanylyltransferase/phosphomannomutase
LPLVLGPLEVEAVTAHAFESDASSGPVRLHETMQQAKKLVAAVNADFGAVFDRSAERVYLIDELGHEIPPEQALLLYLRLISSNGHRGKVVVPINTTRQVERLVGEGIEIVRTPVSLPDLTRMAAGDGVLFGGAVGGGYVFPEFLPAYDAIASLCKLLQLLAPVQRPLSELVGELPRPTLRHREVQCSWALKGVVMRVLNERYSDANVDLLDGIKIFDDRGWVQVLPDPDEPLIHIYAEGDSAEVSTELEEDLRRIVTDVIERDEAGARN